MRTASHPRRPARTPPWRRIALLTFLALCVWLGVEYGRLPEVGDLERKNPATTALIEARAEEARAHQRSPKKKQLWVSLDDVAPIALAAVLVSEDARFFQHQGVDLKETRIAAEEALEEKKLGRGASTITQQLARNLWLSQDRSLLRKAKELILARRLEEGLSKRRILTLYVNVAEWGDGVYGIEAASRTWFKVSASELSAAQAAVLASMLPAPRRWTPASGSPRLRARAERLIDRLAQYGRLSEVNAAVAKLELERIFGGADGAAVQ